MPTTDRTRATTHDAEGRVPHRCRVCASTNPADAVYCYRDGRPLLKDGDQGPMRVGSMPFPRAFYFSDGQPCSNFNELVLGCERHWEEARDFLAQGLWPEFFAGLGRLDLATAAKQAALEADRDRGLSQLLEHLPADPDFLRPAKLAVDSTQEYLKHLTPGSKRSFPLQIANQGTLLLHGLVWTDCDWLVLGDRSGPQQKMFQTRTGCSLPVFVVGGKLRAGRTPLKGKIVIESNGGTVTVKVRAEVPIHPFPRGKYANDSLADATSPGELALKAKAAPREAAILFEKGAVREWYATNGWTYPIEGSAGQGEGAVQQFFEALGLTKPPHLEISAEPLSFRGKAGERLVQKVVVRTDEPRPVYAHAWSNRDWITFGPSKYLRNKVTIPVEITVPSCPNEMVTGQVNIQGNGNQRFSLPVSVAVEPGRAPVARGGDEGEETLEELPAGGTALLSQPAVLWGAGVFGTGLLSLLILWCAMWWFAPQGSGPREPPPPVPPAVSVEGSFATPRAVFTTARVASAKGDFETFARCLTQEGRDLLAGSFLLSVNLLKKAPANPLLQHEDLLEEIFAPEKDAGKALDNVDAVLADFPPQGAGRPRVRKLLLDLAHPLRNKSHFLRDLLRGINASTLASKAGLFGENPTLANLKTSDREATADVVSDDGSTHPIAFRKAGADWQIDFPEPLSLFRSLLGFPAFQGINNQITPLQLENDQATVQGPLHFFDPLDRVQKSPCKTYKIRMDKGSTYFFDLDSNDFQPALRLEDAVETRLILTSAESNAGKVQARFVAPFTGTYRLIAATASGTGMFALKIRCDSTRKLDDWLNAAFGRWDLLRVKDAGVLLQERDSQRALLLQSELNNQVLYRDGAGKEHLLHASEGASEGDQLFQKFAAALAGKPSGKQLARGVYQLGNWKIMAKDDQLEFQPADATGKGRLLILRSATAFTYNDQVYENATAVAPEWLTLDGLGRAVRSGALQPKDPADRVTKSPFKAFKLRMKQDHPYVLKLQGTHAEFQPYLRLEDAAGTEVARAFKGPGLPAEVRFQPVADGDYQIIATHLGRTAGTYSLLVWEEQPQPPIPNNPSGSQYFFQNGARFGRWSLWTCPPQPKPARNSAFVLLNQQSGQTIHLLWTSPGGINYRAEGKWSVLSLSGQAVRANPELDRVCSELELRPTPTRKLADGKYKGGNWNLTITGQEMEFRHTRGSWRLVLRPDTEEFNFLGRTYPAGAADK